MLLSRIHISELVDLNRMRNEKQKLPFIKMQGAGNDYIYFNCFKQSIESPESLSVPLSDRHFGIGGDGVVLICPSSIADAKMRMFNLDGSEGKMCGNAIRCVGKYLYETGMVKKTEMKIETLSGIRSLWLYVESGIVKSVRVDMGPAVLDPKQIPVAMDKDIIVDCPAVIGGKEHRITCVSMGNPHCVTFLSNVDALDINREGPLFENDTLFPERVNAEFVQVIDKNLIKMRVWERGSGETMACGTGACAAVVACVLNGFCNKGEEVTVKLLGGDLTIEVTDEAVYMTGTAQKVFEGVVEL